MISASSVKSARMTSPSAGKARPLDSMKTIKSTSDNSVNTETLPRAEQSDDNDDVFRRNGAASMRRVPMNPRMRLASYLSALFVLCTVMFPVAFFSDIFGVSPLSGLRISSMILVQVYTLICPILLVRFLPSLKSALISMGATIQGCCK